MLNRLTRAVKTAVRRRVHECGRTIKHMLRPVRTGAALVCAVSIDAVRPRSALVAENALLRQQILVLRRAARRCCTNRHEPARCPPTGSSPADAIRHWSAEGGHPIQDLTAEDGLTPLPSWTPGAKAIADDGLVAEERILHPALTMVP